MTCKSFFLGSLSLVMLVVLFSVLIFLFSGLCRAPSQQRQWACPGRSNHAHIRSVFVDSGAFPDGIYREHDAFMTLNTSTTTRICGLFSSSSPSGSGDVSMWVPAVHPTLGRAWRHLLIPQQPNTQNQLDRQRNPAPTIRCRSAQCCL